MLRDTTREHRRCIAHVILVSLSQTHPAFCRSGETTPCALSNYKQERICCPWHPGHSKDVSVGVASSRVSCCYHILCGNTAASYERGWRHLKLVVVQSGETFRLCLSSVSLAYRNADTASLDAFCSSCMRGPATFPTHVCLRNPTCGHLRLFRCEPACGGVMICRVAGTPQPILYKGAGCFAF